MRLLLIFSQSTSQPVFGCSSRLNIALSFQKWESKLEPLRLSFFKIPSWDNLTQFQRNRKWIKIYAVHNSVSYANCKETHFFSSFVLFHFCIAFFFSNSFIFFFYQQTISTIRFSFGMQFQDDSSLFYLF